MEQNRIWIFASPSPLGIDISNRLKNDIDDFLQKWQAHGKDLIAKSQIVENHFIIIEVDENLEKASGCSIDSMVHLIGSLEKKYQINLSERSLVYYKSGSEIKNSSFLDIKAKISNGELDENTMVYNNAIGTAKEYYENWKLPLKKTWLNKYLEKTAV